MRNYLKIFRFRKLANDAEHKQIADERIVFFDDADAGQVNKACEKAREHRDIMTKKHAKSGTPIRIAIWYPVNGVRAHEIGAFFGELS